MSEVDKPGEPDPCPHCGTDLRAGRIPQESLDKGYYGEPTDVPRYFSHKVGVERPEIYDGVLYWVCPFCGWAWNRWPEGHPRFLRAQAIVAETQQAVTDREASTVT